MNYEELAKRAVACKGWRFMGGMLVADTIGKQRVYDDVAGEPYWSADGWLPDLTDPATLGCLLALVREIWGDNTASTAATRELDKTTGWIMDCWDPQSPLNKVGPFKTEAEALVAALEVAP